MSAENGTKRPADDALAEPAAKKLATEKSAVTSTASPSTAPALEDVTFEITIMAHADKLYDIFTDATKFKEATSLEAKFSLGSRVFSVRRGKPLDIFGRFVHVVKDKLIVQEFRAANYDSTAPDSTVSLSFSKITGWGAATSIRFALLQVPKQHKSELESFWKDDIFTKIKAFVGDDKKIRAGRNICHLEILADDPARASKFYEEVFGWNMSMWQDYYGFNSGPKDSQWGWVDGGFTKREQAANSSDASGSVPYYLCEVADFEKKVVAAGGKVVKPLTKEHYGTVAHCLDTEGNRFVLYEM